MVRVCALRGKGEPRAGAPRPARAAAAGAGASATEGRVAPHPGAARSCAVLSASLHPALDSRWSPGTLRAPFVPFRTAPALALPPPTPTPPHPADCQLPGSELLSVRLLGAGVGDGVLAAGPGSRVLEPFWGNPATASGECPPRPPSRC